MKAQAGVFGERLLSVREVSEILGLSIRTVYRQAAGGDFPKPIKVGGSSRFLLSEILAFFDRMKRQR